VLFKMSLATRKSKDPNLTPKTATATQATHITLATKTNFDHTLEPSGNAILSPIF